MAGAVQSQDYASAKLAQEVIDGQTYWFAASVSPVKAASSTAHLLPNYDEYFIGFKDRSAIMNELIRYKPEELLTGLSAHIMVIAGQVVGGWKRTLQKKGVEIELAPLKPLTKAEKRTVAVAAEQYGIFLELPVMLTWHETKAA